MTFEPKSGEHAIIECVVGLQLARDISQAEIEAIVAAHDEFKNDLPRVGRTSAIEFIVGGETPFSTPAAVQIGGLTFDRIKPDGSLDWRLRVDGRSIFVNCLSYDRWEKVWATSKDYLERVAVHLNPDTPVSGMLLQYIDVFEWKGDANKIDASMLFSRDSELIPKSIWDKGPLWHLYQGWFKSVELASAKRMLEKAHVDALSDAKGMPWIKIDSWHSIELKQSVGLVEALKLNIDETFKLLHSSNKTLLKALLAKEISDRIKLNG